jgi:pimeloyl-ACP methyl ester carboxylesterase
MMMEHPYSIAAPGGYQVYGVYHESDSPSDYAVVQIHGLTGDMGSYSQLTMARFFARHGVPVFRFNQYSDLVGARKFHETTIRGHVADTKLVIEYAVSKGFKGVVLVGHSLGAVVAITAVDEAVRGLLLWEPSGPPAERILDWETREVGGTYSYLDWRTRVVLGEEWIADAKSFPDPVRRIAALSLPVKIIAGDGGGVLPHCERYRDAAARTLEYVVLKNCGHVFLEEGALDQLSSESLSWIRKTVATFAL